MLEIGRLAVKTAGREAGRVCVVVKKIDDNYVMVTGPKSLTKVKRRRCNIQHLEPLTETIKIGADAPDADVLKACREGKVMDKLKQGTAKALEAAIIPEEPEKQALPKPKEEKKPEPKKEKPREKKESKPETKKEKPEVEKKPEHKKEKPKEKKEPGHKKEKPKEDKRKEKPKKESHKEKPAKKK